MPVIAIAVVGDIDLERRRAALRCRQCPGEMPGCCASFFSARCRMVQCEVSMPPSSACSQLHSSIRLLTCDASPAPASIRISAAAAASRAGPCRPRSRRSSHTSDRPTMLDLVQQTARGSFSCRRIARRCRISSRDRRSAARSPRCGPARARRGDADRTPRSGRYARRSCGRRRASRRATCTRTGGQSGSGSSHDNSAGIQ